MKASVQRQGPQQIIRRAAASECEIFVIEHKAESATLSDMKTLARYLEAIVDPTFDEFLGNTGSFRPFNYPQVSEGYCLTRFRTQNGYL